jgi:hypothetical protein
MKSTEVGFKGFSRAFPIVFAIMMLITVNAIAQQVITGEVY